MQKRTKFNVDKNVAGRSCDGIVFDSRVEMLFYRDVVLPGVERGEIINYELQKPYELQPKFEYNGATVRAITYVADFYVEYADGHSEVIDIKGMADSVAKLKRKLFYYRYPDVQYRWLSYAKKWGGWLDYDELQKIRRNNKKGQKGELNNGEGNEKGVCQCGGQGDKRELL